MLVPPGRPHDLASAVTELASDERLRSRLARAGLEPARSLSLERQTARLASFLKGPRGGAAR
jgi:glycosyltransferase involved in cell wall biosynthesis